MANVATAKTATALRRMNKTAFFFSLLQAPEILERGNNKTFCRERVITLRAPSIYHQFRYRHIYITLVRQALLDTVVDRFKVYYSWRFKGCCNHNLLAIALHTRSPTTASSSNILLLTTKPSIIYRSHFPHLVPPPELCLCLQAPVG